MAPGFLYRISASNSNRIYVGQSIEPEVRWRQHLNLAKAGTHKNVLLARFLMRHKDAVFIYWPVENVLQAERDYEIQARLDGFDLMNLIPCGQPTPLTTGFRHSLLSRAKMSAYRKGIPKSEAHRRNIALGRTGKQHSEATKLKMRESHRRRLGKV